MPTKNNVIYNTKEIGGSHVCTLLRPQQILAFNSNRNGAMSIFDIRNQQIIDTIDLGNEEITAVGLSKDQQTLMTGSKDGIVKVWDVHNNFNLRESIEAFYESDTRKKHEVSCVAQHPVNHAFFASSYDGIIKLLRI